MEQFTLREQCGDLDQGGAQVAALKLGSCLIHPRLDECNLRQLLQALLVQEQLLLVVLGVLLCLAQQPGGLGGGRSDGLLLTGNGLQGLQRQGRPRVSDSGGAWLPQTDTRKRKRASFTSLCTE